MTDRIDELREAIIAACGESEWSPLASHLRTSLRALRPKAEAAPSVLVGGPPTATEYWVLQNERDRLAAENDSLKKDIDFNHDQWIGEKEAMEQEMRDLTAERDKLLGLLNSCRGGPQLRAGDLSEREQQIRDLTAERDRLKAEVDRLRTAQTEVKADLQQMVALLTGKEQP